MILTKLDEAIKRTRMDENSSFFRRWRFVFFYTLIIYGTIYFVPFVTKAFDDIGLGWFIKDCPVVTMLLAVCFLLYRLRHVGRKKRLLLYTSLAATGAMYGYMLVNFLTHPVERVHLIEYGLLGLLVFRAMEGRYETWRVYIYSVVIVLSIGFIDEVIQGPIPNRYYDPRDVLTNVISGGLALCVLAIFRATYTRITISFSSPIARSKRRQSDISAAAALIIVVFFIWFIDYVPVDPKPLYGKWEKISDCVGTEALEFLTDGQFVWRDTSGHESQGTFYLDGNRLEGTRLFFSIERSNNTSKCGIPKPRKSKVRSPYLIMTGDGFYLDKSGPWYRKP